jgi:hypothetical protein
MTVNQRCRETVAGHTSQRCSPVPADTSCWDEWLPIEGTAVAVNGQALLTTLVRRDDESVPALLQRLDEALGKAMHQGVVTNEINGGRFRLAPPKVRKNR